MTRSPDSLVPSGSGQPETEKRDDKALTCWQEGEANAILVMLEKGVHGNLLCGEIPGAYPMNAFPVYD